MAAKKKTVTKTESPSAAKPRAVRKTTVAKSAPTGKAPAAKKAPVRKAVAAAKPAPAKKAAAARKPAAPKKAAPRKIAVKKVALPKPVEPPKPVLPTEVNRIVELLQEKKAESVVVLDMRKLSSIADYFILATGLSGPQLRAMSDEVALRLKKEGNPVRRRAGSPDSGWIVLDYVDIVVHLMSPDARSYYALEELWNDAPKTRPA